jgi:hypothetical protein
MEIKEKEIMEISKNKLYFSVSKLINHIGTEKYEMISPLLANILTEEQLKQVIKEKGIIEREVYKKINENPFDIKLFKQLSGDSETDFIQGIMSKPEDFITKFLTDDLTTHNSINLGISNEFYNYSIPYETSIAASKNNSKDIEKYLEESNVFVEELRKTEELSDIYKDKIIEGVSYLQETIKKLKSNSLEPDFDPESIKSYVVMMKKQENFCKPLYNSLSLNSGVFHYGLENLVTDHLRNQKINDFKEKYSAESLFKDFDDKYMIAHENKDYKTLENKANKFEEFLNRFNQSINVKSQSTKVIKNKR